MIQRLLHESGIVGGDGRKSTDQATGGADACLSAGSNPRGTTDLELSNFLHHFPDHDPDRQFNRLLVRQAGLPGADLQDQVANVQKLASSHVKVAMHRALLNIVLLALLSAPSLLATAEAAPRTPVADILGKTVYDDDLVPRKADDEQKARLSPADHLAWQQRTREEVLRTRVWSAVFTDYALKRKIEATPAEIDSKVQSQKEFMAADKVRREKQREELIAELKAPGVSDTRRKQAQQHLDTVNSLRDHDARMQSERSDPAAEKSWRASEQKVAALWVKQWKVNQALYREFGGRIIFQQAGWEPIDAYRLLLDEYKGEKRFVVHDPRLQDAVYSYFKHRFVYADETKAKFYFEKPFWERTQEEIRAAGF